MSSPYFNGQQTVLLTDYQASQLGPQMSQTDYQPSHGDYNIVGSKAKLNPYGLNSYGLPSLGINLRKHKLAITLGWLPIIVTGGIFPIAGYFILRYGTTQKLSIVLAPWLALMGVASLYSLVTRTWRLVKKDSDCRPLDVESRWTMDFFEWNFVFGFLALTAFISAGSSTSNMTIVAMPDSVLLLYVCTEVLLVRFFMARGFKAPFRLSSVAKGEEIRPASYVIFEDIVAVDAKQGQAFRKALSDRYEASPIFRAHLRKMDLFWGVSGLCLVGVIWGLAIGLRHERKTQEIAYSLGVTTLWSQRMLVREEQEQNYRSTA